MADESEVGFLTMGRAGGPAEARTIGVGMLGYAFMGKAHSNAYRKIAYMTWPPPLVPRLVAISGRTEEAVAEAARRYGFERYTTDWRELLATTRSSSSTTAGRTTSTPSRRSRRPRPASTSSARSRSARTADESYEVWQRVAAAGVKHMCAFNYRFVPAVRLAREMLEAGDLGDDLPLPRPLSPGVGRHRRRGVALRLAPPPARARSATSART